jgi:hypothetical protein
MRMRCTVAISPEVAEQIHWTKVSVDTLVWVGRTRPIWNRRRDAVTSICVIPIPKYNGPSPPRRCILADGVAPRENRDKERALQPHGRTNSIRRAASFWASRLGLLEAGPEYRLFIVGRVTQRLALPGTWKKGIYREEGYSVSARASETARHAG